MAAAQEKADKLHLFNIFCIMKYSPIILLSMMLAVVTACSNHKPAVHLTDEPFRSVYHHTPEANWMNDPNGMFYDEANGIWHLYYQYYPEGTVWGPMHWGHSTSQDLIHWDHQPIAIYPDENGMIPADAVADAVNEDTFLVSMMLVNNETGAVLPVSKAFNAIHRRFPKVITHCDCVQGYMKLPIKTKTLGADLISLSAHKICGPKGIGALYIRKGLHIPALLMGGGQEKNMRSGTESVPLICGFGEAVKHYSGSIAERLENAKKLESLLFELCEKNGGIGINFRGEKSPYVTSITVDGLKSEVLLHYLEKREIFVSSGSACSKGKKSGVLAEFRIPVRDMDTTLRISFSPDTTEDDLYGLIEGISAAQSELARLK